MQYNNTLQLSAPDHLKNHTVELPLSKSIINRSMIIGFLAGYDHSQFNADSDDTTLMYELLLKLKNPIDFSVYDAGPAGTVFRFLCALMSITPGIHVLTGSERMQQRPVGPLVEALNQLGAEIKYLEKIGYPPLEIHGREIRGGELEIDATISSQFISALLMIGPYLQSGLRLKLIGKPVSSPYIDLTIGIMSHYGVHVVKDIDLFIVPKGIYSFNSIMTEADWSAASYWYALIALKKESSVILSGLNSQSLQGDIRIIQIFEQMGVRSSWHSQNLHLVNTGIVKQQIILDLNDCPDLAPSVAIVCAGLQIDADLTGLETLVIKESNRLFAISKELNQLGYSCSVSHNNQLKIRRGKKDTNSCTVKTYNDHRIAMSFAILCVMMERIIIENPQVVSKSYPTFWQHLDRAGFIIFNDPV